MIQANKRMAAWSTTVSGKKFHPFNPDGRAIDITDIATALSNQCRFNGHVKRRHGKSGFYSVAEHSTILSHIVSPKSALLALLHDAPEAYIGDMIAPLKEHFPEFIAVENLIMDEVIERFDVPIDPVIVAEVHTADQWIVHLEARELHTTPDILSEWGKPPIFKPRVHVDPATFGMAPEDAYVAFLVRFGDLVAEELL